MRRTILFLALAWLLSAPVTAADDLPWGDVLLKPERARGRGVDWELAFRSTQLKPLPDGAGYVDVAVVTDQPFQRVWVTPPTSPGRRDAGDSMRVRGRVQELILDPEGYVVLVRRSEGTDPLALRSPSTSDYESALALQEARRSSPPKATPEPLPSPRSDSDNAVAVKPKKTQETKPPIINAPKKTTEKGQSAGNLPKKAKEDKTVKPTASKPSDKPEAAKPAPAKPKSDPKKPSIQAAAPPTGETGAKPKKAVEKETKAPIKPKSASIEKQKTEVEPDSGQSVSGPPTGPPPEPAAPTGAAPARPEISEADARRNSSGLEWKEESWVATVERGCSLRAGPGTAFVPLPDTVEESILRVEGSRGPWCFVRKGQVTGWIYRSCLQKPKPRK